MKKIIKSFIKFFEGQKGEKSSKRLIFIMGSFQLFVMVKISIIYFLYSKNFNEAIELLKWFGLAVLIMGGFVTTEVLTKLKNKND